MQILKIHIILLFLPFLFISKINAQFDFQYNGPDTLFVEDMCFTALEWGSDTTPIVTSTIGGVSITSFEFNEDLTGYELGEPVGQNLIIDIAYIAENSNGDIDTFYFQLNTIDNSPPVIISSPISVSVSGNSPIITLEDWINSHANAIASDNCTMGNSIIWISTENNFTSSCGNSGIYDYTFTALDIQGNTTSVDATYEITDNEAPIITQNPQDITFECSSTNLQTVLNNWIDNLAGMEVEDFSGIESWNYSWTDNNGNSGDDIYPTVEINGCEFNVELIITATDSCGFSVSDTASYSVSDLIGPIFTVFPNDTIIECGQIIPVGNVDATDQCNSVDEITYSTDTLFNTACPVIYKLVRTYQAIDICGNSTNRTQIITVEDNIAPVFTYVPTDQSIDCSMPISTPIPTAIDECSFVMTTLEESYNPSVGCNGNEIILTRTWTATDICGNENTAQQIVTINDMTGPEFDVPSDITISCDEDLSQINTGIPTNIIDNCDNNPTYSYTENYIIGYCTYVYSYERIWAVEDACGNISIDTQYINIVDQTPPVLDIPPTNETIECSSDAEIDVLFTNWVNNYGGAIISDNCTQEDEYLWLVVNSGTFTPAFLPPSECNGQNNIYRHQSVDFYAIDNCGNLIGPYVASFTVLDNTSPEIICPDDIFANNNPGTCEADIIINPPLFFDGCNGSSIDFNIGATNNPQILTSDNPGDINSLFDSLSFVFDVESSNIYYANEDVNLTILLQSIDGDDTYEYFIIIGEDGTILGQTNNSPTECGNSNTTLTIPSVLFNQWASNGEIIISLVPFDPMENNLPIQFGMNDICDDSSAFGYLEYSGITSGDVNYSISLNNQTSWIEIDNIEEYTTSFSENGLVFLKIEDCSGNESTCYLEVTINDIESPEITCEESILIDVEETCDTTFQFSLPYDVSDNCEFDKYSNSSSILQMTFSNYGSYGYVANDINYSFINTEFTATSDALLTIGLKGDINDIGEHFTILGENNTVLDNTINGSNPVGGITGQGIGCFSSFSTFDFIIPRDTIEKWASDGIMNFSLISNKDTITFNDFIQPCSLITEVGDEIVGIIGENEIFLTLSYNYARYSYTLADDANNIIIPSTEIGTISDQELTLNSGEYSLIIKVEDAAGNTDSCQQEIIITDTGLPTARCKDTTIYINPSGVDSYQLDGTEIDSFSFDNCEIESYTTIPSSFNCNQSGTTHNAILIVSDSSGNTGTCVSSVFIDLLAPDPYYSLGLCLNDTIKFHPNVPGGETSLFSYQWTNPQGIIFSTDSTPVLSGVTMADEGTYNLMIIGQTGCSSSKEFQVSLGTIPNTPVIEADTNIVCEHEVLEITTTSFGTNNVFYIWHIVTPELEEEILTTSSPSLFYEFDTYGTYNIFLYVDIEGCNSNVSNLLTLSSIATPIVNTNTAIMFTCLGDSINLGTNYNSPNSYYLWEGPNNYSSTLQFPETFAITTDEMAGTYTLTVSLNGCSSFPSTTEVILNSTPEKPVIETYGIVCENDTATIFTDIPFADLYYWISPESDTIIATENSLFFNNISNSENGWTIYVEKNGCFSEVSDPLDNFISSLPEIEVSSNTPICSNDSILLMSSYSPMIDYLWTGPNNFSSNLQNTFDLATNNSGQYEYCLNATNSMGCQSEECFDIEILSKPTITSISQNITGCVTGNDILLLIPTVFPQNIGEYEYTWSFENGVIFNTEIATIENASESDNGVYSFTVRDGLCVSDTAYHTVSLIDSPSQPIAPFISNLQSLCIGDSLILTTTQYTFDDIIYDWTGPGGNYTTTNNTLVISNITEENSGLYVVRATHNFCSSLLSSATDVIINPIPETPIISSNSPICEGDSIHLQILSPINPQENFNWSGPNNFESDLSSPSIANASLDNEGYYSLRIESAGCYSNYSDSINISITENFDIPEIVDISDICLDGEQSLNLSITNETYDSDLLYTWISGEDDTLGQTNNQSYILNDFSLFTEGVIDIHVIGSLNNCTETSTVTNITAYSIPSNIASVCSPSIVYCSDETIHLCADNPDIGLGKWTQSIIGDEPSVLIIDPFNKETEISGTEAGYTYTFIWTLSNGICGDYSSVSQEIVINGIISNPTAIGGQVCNETEFEISGTGIDSNTTGFWSQPDIQELAGIIIQSPTSAITTVSNLVPGNEYYFTWTLTSLDCGFSSSVDITVSVDIIPSIIANAGEDIITCSENNIQLNAIQPEIGNGEWTTENNEIIIDNIESANTFISNLNQGDNILFWSLSNGACENYSTDDVSVFYIPFGFSMNDTIEVIQSERVTFDVTVNDNILGEYNLTYDDPKSGFILANNGSEFSYISSQNYIGLDSFSYTICSEICQNECSTAIVYINIIPNDDCSIPTIITPNSDGINDEFSIPCLGNNQHPFNTVKIFNQWGNEIFIASPYQNNWKGTYNGTPVPSGTYFFLVDFGDNTPTQSGFLLIER